MVAEPSANAHLLQIINYLVYSNTVAIHHAKLAARAINLRIADEMSGRNRGHGNKRRRDDDDYHYTPRDDGRGPQRPRHDNGPRRSRMNEAVWLRENLIDIASSTKLPEDEAIEIAERLRDNYDDEEARNEFFDALVLLCVEQPLKIPFAAAVVFYGNQIKSDITAEAIRRVGDRLQTALKAGQWKDVKLCLRFLACLQPLFEEDGIFAFLAQLFDTVVDQQSANENDVVGIELVKIILLTIPYALASGGSNYHGKAQELLDSTGIVAGNVLDMEALIHPYESESEDKVIGYHSVISLLQQQLVIEAASGWELSCIPKFDVDAIRKKDPEADLPEAPPTYAFPALAIPSPVNPGDRPLFPEAYFSLFTDQELATVPKTTEIAASLIRDAIVDTIDSLDFNRDKVAKYLIELDCYWSLDTFTKRAITFDKFKDHVGDRTMYKSEDMVIDAIFSMLFKLPTPQHKLVYFHSVITTCCKTAPSAIAPSLGRAIRAIYKSIHVMDLELSYRFMDWFSHHMSNFEFRWRWAEWLEDLELSDLHPKKAFIIATIEKEIRLSFAKRIRQTLPDEMHSLIPKADDTVPKFKFDNEEMPFAVEGKTLLGQIRKKASNEEIQETIDKIHEQANEQGITDALAISTDVLVTAICRVGATSLSHVLSYIDRNKDRLVGISQESDSARSQIVTSVVEYWKFQPGVAVHIINLLLNYKVLAPINVIQWVFDTYMGAGDALAKSWIYELVANTVAKQSSRNLEIVTYRLQKGLSEEAAAAIDEQLKLDRGIVRELFKFIDDALKGYAEGSADRLIEKETNGEISTEDGQLIRDWGKRWRTVFTRKATIEESVVGEEAVEAKLRYLAAQPDEEPEAMQAEDTNGAQAEDMMDEVL